MSAVVRQRGKPELLRRQPLAPIFRKCQYWEYSAPFQGITKAEKAHPGRQLRRDAA